METFDPDFETFVQFGLIDNGLLIIPTLAGAELDDWIAAKVGTPGYGPLLGAAIGNAVSDGLAGLAESPEAAWGSLVGAMLPVAIVAVPMVLKMPLKGVAKYAIGAASIALILASLARRRSH